ncbi:MAG: glutathione peroxidase [Anaerolineaceae bacterium]|nr:glutathione peroxidase [Anaerolineaceae bacterium]
MTVHAFTVHDARGKELPLSAYQGKVLLLVNTASQCGFTPQYAGLQQLHETLSEHGLLILAFPCDQFGHQEPGSNAEIQQFCQLNYGVNFPVLAKIEVNGPAAHPLYRYLTEQKPGPQGPDIQWNFTKFIIDPSGAVVQRFEPSVTPAELLPHIQLLLS